MAFSSFDAKGTPQAQLRFFIENLNPKDQKLFRSIRSAVRKRLPTANELCMTTTPSWSSGIRRTMYPRMGSSQSPRVRMACAFT